MGMHDEVPADFLDPELAKVAKQEGVQARMSLQDLGMPQHRPEGGQSRSYSGHAGFYRRETRS